MRKHATLAIILATGLALALTLGGAVGASVATKKKGPVKLSGKVNDQGKATVSGEEITLTQENFSFTPTYVKTPAGIELHVEVHNESDAQHTFTVRGTDVDVTLDPGTNQDVRVMVPSKGALNFFCRFHRNSSGMQGAFYTKKGAKVVKAVSTGSGGSQYGY